MRKLFPAATLATCVTLLLAAAPRTAAEEPPADDGVLAAATAPAGEGPGFSRAAVRALLAEIFGGDDPAPADTDEAGALARELGGNLRLELRYDSRGPFERHLADPREAEHFVFLQLRTRL